mmetsp:Transcript_19005/g.73195  ORF Transcript_19005/g.73195 Transcript_19005/m.73195 type:complete len:273 (+) Transcript_19005:54-872(+)
MARATCTLREVWAWHTRKAVASTTVASCTTTSSTCGVTTCTCSCCRRGGCGGGCCSGSWPFMPASCCCRPASCTFMPASCCLCAASGSSGSAAGGRCCCWPGGKGAGWEGGPWPDGPACCSGLGLPREPRAEEGPAAASSLSVFLKSQPAPHLLELSVMKPFQVRRFLRSAHFAQRGFPCTVSKLASSGFSHLLQKLSSVGSMRMEARDWRATFSRVQLARLPLRRICTRSAMNCSNICVSVKATAKARCTGSSTARRKSWRRKPSAVVNSA